MARCENKGREDGFRAEKVRYTAAQSRDEILGVLRVRQIRGVSGASAYKIDSGQ